MPLTRESTIEEVAATVSQAMTDAGLTAVLSGGAAVQIYSKGLYASRDLDFVSPAALRQIEAVVRRLGFVRHAGRHFVHADVPYTLEFPPWPLAVGDEVLREWGALEVGPAVIQILTPTQCAMDRLAAFYHWGDRQGLDQAAAVAGMHPVEMSEIEDWSIREGHQDKFSQFQRAVAATREAKPRAD